MAGTKNDTVIGKNADFSQAGGPNATSGEANGLNADGQLWIGSAALNAGGTHINVGTLTSPDGSITVGYSSPNITVQVNGGTTVGKTITGDTGGALSPTLGNWNILSTATAGSSTSFSGSGSTLSFNTSDALLNTIIGQTAGNASITGSTNTGVGYGTLFSLTSGASNTSLGRNALFSVTSGSNNTAIGHAALSNASGQTFTDNTVVGASSAGGLRSSAIQNTCLGSQSLNGVLTGTNNIAVGYNAGSGLASSDSSNIVIGNSGSFPESNTTRIGTQGSGAGQQNRCFIAGIAGVANSNSSVTTVNTSTGQLGNDTTNFNVLSTGLQLKGNNTNTAPPAGFIGEQIRGFASGVAITSTTPTTVTSITLTAGVWDISCIINYTIAGGGAGYFITAISTTTNSLGSSVDGDSRATYTFNANSIIQWSHSIPAYRVLLNSTTTYYLVGQPSFTPGTCAATGRISATRVC